VAVEEKSFKPGIVIGSFVEGAGAEVESVHLAFPFTRLQFDEAVAAVEARVNDIWSATRGRRGTRPRRAGPAPLRGRPDRNDNRAGDVPPLLL
jgi:hypothetical protein